MNLLIINCGSSTLKFQLLQAAPAETSALTRVLAQGLVERIGKEGNYRFERTGAPPEEGNQAVPDHAQAVRLALDWLQQPGAADQGGIAAAGHRVVHGGARFTQATLIDDAVLSAIEDVSTLAPLHNGPSLEAIYAARDALGSHTPMVAVFDTAFHAGMPERAYRYAIPRDMADRRHIRRYGFHGIAHQQMAERAAELLGRPIEETRLITLQLGNGCSICAVHGGRSVDTSMGLTPLEGLVMGTRSGDVDPSLPMFLAQREGLSLEEADDLLNRRSGLLGLSGLSQDMRELQTAAENGDAKAALAIDIFCYRARKYVGAYMAALGGADAVIFGGGIGENAPPVRERICRDMDWAGLRLDSAANASTMGNEGRISTPDSRVAAFVVPVDEAAVIAQATLQVLRDANIATGEP